MHPAEMPEVQQPRVQGFAVHCVVRKVLGEEAVLCSVLVFLPRNAQSVACDPVARPQPGEQCILDIGTEA